MSCAWSVGWLKACQQQGQVSELAFLIDRGNSRLEVVEERQD